MSRLSMRSWDTAGAVDGDVPSYEAATDQYVPKAPAGGGGGGSARVAVIKYAGTLTVGAGQTRLYNDTGAAWTISAVRASVETAATSGATTVDVNINGTTIFTTQTNRPSIAATAVTSGKVTTIDVTSVVDGSYLTVDIDAVGTGAKDLTVEVTFS